MRRRQDRVNHKKKGWCHQQTDEEDRPSAEKMEVLEQQITMLTSWLDHHDAKKTKVTVIPRERDPKLSGRPTSERDPEVIEWAEDMRRMTADMTESEGVQFVLDHLARTAEDEVRLCPVAD